MDLSSHPPFASGSAICTQMPKDHVLNMSPRPSQHLNPSSAELVKEIALLEVKIVHLERYLLSLYRTAFQQHFPSFSGNDETHVQQKKGIYPCATSDQPTQETKLEMTKDYNHRQRQSSPKNALACSNDLENKNAYSCIDDALVFPDRLSEDIIRCISSIYCKLANPARTHKGNSVSSNSSFCSSNTFSTRNLSGSWSPQCSDEITELCDSEILKRDDPPYSAMVEVVEICLDDESFKYAATMLQKFRSLVKTLAIVDLTKTRREQKLAFWINIHNALVMHSYLAYGTQNYIKSTTLKATYNVGGHCVNANDIQRYILGIKSHYTAPWLQTLLSPGKKLKTETIKHAYGIEYPEPLVHFALCLGTYSDPAVRVYTAKTVFRDLKVAKDEFVRATVQVHKQTKVYLPKILQYYAKDMSLGIAALSEVVSECLPGTQPDANGKFVKGQREKCVHWLEQSSSFRYLIHKEVAGRRWGA